VTTASFCGQSKGTRGVSVMGTRSRIVLLVVVLLVSGFMGLMVAMAFAPGDQQSGQLVKRVRNGVTETGRLETVTSNGVVKRVIHWRTRTGELLTQTIEGPIRLVRVNGQSIYVPGPSRTSTVFGTTTLPGGTVVVTGPGVTSVETLPGETVHDTVTETLPAETVTETVHETETDTEIYTVTDTVTNTVTQVETVTETVAAPGP
jgi:hypothetical protein